LFTTAEQRTALLSTPTWEGLDQRVGAVRARTIGKRRRPRVRHSNPVTRGSSTVRISRAARRRTPHPGLLVLPPNRQPGSGQTRLARRGGRALVPRGRATSSVWARPT
jgi:hypothetical protein